jgi:hypothetical protein
MNESLTPFLASFAVPPDTERRRAVLTAATLCDRNGGSRADLEDVLAMLDLTDTAWEILGRARPAPRAVGGARDGIGRLRSCQAPATAIPEPATPAEPALCNAGLHPKAKPGRCLDCKNAGRRAARAELRAVEAKNAGRWAS